MKYEVSREPFYSETSGIPFTLQFLERESEVTMPAFDESSQMHLLSESPQTYIANMTTTAKPNQRDNA